eukprot:12732805-Ditylum_brightwellii.AAC.1
MGVLPDEVHVFADIDPNQLYDIDEVTIDTTESRANGAYCRPGNSDDGYEEYGAIPQYIVHSSKGKSNPDKGERTENDNDFVNKATPAFSNG